MSAAVLTEQLKAALKVIPIGIGAASIQQVREYKKWVGRAAKAINQGTRNESVLRSLLNQYEAYK